MRLFLSSENLGKNPEKFLKLIGGSHKLAVVHNAIDDWSANDRAAKIK
jgi:hypothetical protein